MNIEDIVCRYSESQWTMTEAARWFDILTQQGIYIPDIESLYLDGLACYQQQKKDEEDFFQSHIE